KLYFNKLIMRLHNDSKYNTINISYKFKIPSVNNLSTYNNIYQKGSIIFNKQDNEFYGNNGITWVKISGQQITNTLTSAGGDISLVARGAGPDLKINGLTAGNGIDIVGPSDGELITHNFGAGSVPVAWGGRLTANIP